MFHSFVRCLVFIALISIPRYTKAQFDEQLKRDRSFYFHKPPQPKQLQFYFKLGSGFATLYKSDHRGMENFRIPVSLQFEIENNKIPYSLLLNGNLLTRFYIDDFVFSPNAATLNVKYSTAHLLNRPSKLDFYLLAGGGAWYAYLTDIEYAQIKAYENKEEEDFGIGFSGGAGVSYRWNDLDFHLQYLYFYGKARFIAGYFDPQNFYIGSHQLSFLVSYKFWINKKFHCCPSYRKSYK